MIQTSSKYSSIGVTLCRTLLWYRAHTPCVSGQVPRATYSRSNMHEQPVPSHPSDTLTHHDAVTLTAKPIIQNSYKHNDKSHNFAAFDIRIVTTASAGQRAPEGFQCWQGLAVSPGTEEPCLPGHGHPTTHGGDLLALRSGNSPVLFSPQLRHSCIVSSPQSMTSRRK